MKAGLVMMYWHIGRRIQQDVLKQERADYGQEILPTLSEKLTEEFGRGFGRRNLEHMLRFAEVFPDQRIAQTLSAQLSWSHFTELVRKLHDSILLARERLTRCEELRLPDENTSSPARADGWQFKQSILSLFLLSSSNPDPC